MQATKANVRAALITFDQQFRETAEWDGWETRANQLYALKWKGKLYPPKKVLSLATGTPVMELHGGKSTNAPLETLGFTVIRLMKGGEGDELPVFERGMQYNRATEITGRFGGSSRSGICPSAQVPAIFLFTGDSGGKFGYQDHEDASGILHYTGEGQYGDMSMTRGNAAIARHAVDGKTLHVFRTSGKGKACTYLGEYFYGSHSVVQGLDADGKKRALIVFQLVPVDMTDQKPETDDTVDIQVKPSPMDLAELRMLALAAVAKQTTVGDPKATVRIAYTRSAQVKDYVLARAKSICELCETKAPFVSRATGLPYLEPHHINRLSDGGLDHPKYIGAICPTCHRRIHYGVDGHAANEALRVKIEALES
jgi:5-methylcytosine-specific restriction protein A